MNSAIMAIGIANPIYKIKQSNAAEMTCQLLAADAKQRRVIKALYRFTGIEYRHSVLSDSCKQLSEFTFFPTDTDLPFPTTAKRLTIYKENALTLALQAVKDCIAQVKIDLTEITHLITVSCTGMYAPGLDIELVHSLALKSNIKRTTINFMGCYGAFNGIKVADSICQADPDATVLVVCVEICTIHMQKSTHLDNLTSNAIFSDGASCALIQRKKLAQNCLSLTAFHCDLISQTNEEMAWHIGDQGFDMILTSYVPDAIRSGIRLLFDKLVTFASLPMNKIDYYAIHPGAKKILEACEHALSISKIENEYAYQVLANYGNMSSATILFVLKKLWEKRNKTDHDKTIFSCAFGPGLTLESMVLTINSP